MYYDITFNHINKPKFIIKIKSTSSMQDGDNTDIFLKQLIQFCSNKATILHHLTLHSTLDGIIGDQLDGITSLVACHCCCYGRPM